MTFILIQVLIIVAVYWLFRPTGRRAGTDQKSPQPVSRRTYRADADARYRREVARHQAEMNRAIADQQARTDQAVAEQQARTSRETARQEDRIARVKAAANRVQQDESAGPDWW